MTEKEKMSAGMVYSAVDAQLLEELDSVKRPYTDTMQCLQPTSPEGWKS